MAYTDEQGNKLSTEEVVELLRDAQDEFRTLEEQHNQARLDTLSSMVAPLESKLRGRIAQRSFIESRWIEDLRQFHGYRSSYLNYDNPFDDTQKTNRKPQVNITRNKCKTAISKMQDLQFPEKDKNYRFTPTPVPELERISQQDTPEGEASREILMRASLASKAMEKEVWDQLVESRYGPTCREAIRDLVILGTAVLKGPMIKGDVRKQWTLTTDAEGNEVYLAEYVEARLPSVRRVDPWMFYPDMQGTTPMDCEDAFELHPLSKKELQKLAKHPGFDAYAISQLVEDDPDDLISSVQQNKHAVTGNDFFYRGRYQVWEYHGPINEQLIDMAGLTDEDVKDPLSGYHGEIWFCQGKVIKVCLSHLEGETDIPYAFTQWERDETSPFGFGIPFLVRDAQRVVNSTWSMIMDNAGLSAGPQVVVARETIEPANGKWDLEPMKIWYVTEYGQKPDESMFFFDVPSKADHLTNVLEMARLFSDEESSMPLMQQGEQSAQAGTTATGMAMLFNATNVVQKSVNKNWDDNMTQPLISRMYTWNMLYNPKNEIKGDYKVVTLGATDLTNKQLQAQDLNALVQGALSNDVLASSLNVPHLIREWAHTMRIDADTIVKSDEQLQAEAEAAAQNPPPDYEAMKLQLQAEKLEVEKANLELNAAKLQAELEFKYDKLASDYETFMAQAHARVLAEESEREQLIIKMAHDQEMEVADFMAKYEIEERNADTAAFLAMTDLEEKREKNALKRRELDLKERNLDTGHDTFG